MNRGLSVKFALSGLVALAVVDAAQAQIFRRRAWRNDCCCDYGYGNRGVDYGYRGNNYAYSAPMYSSAYVNNCCCQPTGTMMASGVASMPSTSAYADPNAMNNGALTGNSTRVRVQVPTAETQIWVDQHLVQSSGTDRSINMPLNSASAQRVTITAQWLKDGHEVVRKKEVEIRGGQEATVNFTDSDAMAPGELIQTNPNNTPDLNRPNPDKP